jgi:CheY-like chemotaxis protein
MKFLIADDNATNRLVLAAMLKKDGHEVISTEDGKEAVEAFAREAPDMIIMDVMMPVMTGYEATARIKARCGDRFIPVIFLTAITDEQGLAECIKHGGDDFLTKPFNRTILKSKIAALTRIRDLYALVKAQNIQLEAHQNRIRHEQEVAQAVFDRILKIGCSNDPQLRYRLSPTAVLNGDFVLAARKPNGVLHVLSGDMTGHGLSAAVGALPAADIFYAMTASGYDIGDIAAEINRKLKQKLPPGMFCAACLVEVVASECRVTVWNGGMPDVLIYAPGQGLARRIASQHMALGVLSSDDFDPSCITLNIPHDCRLYLCSDGLIEAENGSGEIFGQERLDRCLAPDGDPVHVFDRINDEHRAFCGGAVPHDDVTLVEVTATPLSLEQPSPQKAGDQTPSVGTPWRMAIELTAGALNRIDPLPEVTRLLSEFPVLHGHRESIFTILAELLGNAVDHGLLGLDSAMRATPEGFGEYYTTKIRRLKSLTSGSIRVNLSLQPTETGGCFVVRVEDSGPGFDWQAVERDLAANMGHSGRGILLVRSLCREVRYEGRGNVVEAAYHW